MGLIGLTGIIFLVLKIFGVITWSWLLVLMPIWIPIILFILFLAWIGIKFLTTKPYNL